MDDHDQIKGLIAKTAYDIRGHILQKSIELEMLIDNYITKHFTSDEIKFTEFVCLILCRMSFEGKFQAFSFLLDLYNPDFKENNKGYKKEILDIIKKRNEIAHYPIDFSQRAIELFNEKRIVRFMKFKNSEGDINSINELDEKTVNELINKISHYINLLIKFAE